MSKRRYQTIADYAAIGLAPVLIFGMLSCLAMFLMMVIYAGGYTGRVNWTLLCYTMGVTAIARMTIEQGRGYSIGYTIALGAASLFVMNRFFGGPISSAVVLFVIGYLADRIVHDCTIIDDTIDSSGQGLIDSGRSWFRDQLSTSESSDSEDEKAKAKVGSQPGRTVLYLALGALPLFGIGQFFLRGNDEVWFNAKKLLAMYLFSSLSLLVVTAFLNLRRYLRQRHTEMPTETTVAWLAGGMAMIAVILMVALISPMPGQAITSFQIPDFLKNQDVMTASRFGWGGESAESGSKSDATTSDPDSDFESPEDAPKDSDRSQSGAPPGGKKGQRDDGPVGEDPGGKKGEPKEGGDAPKGKQTGETKEDSKKGEKSSQKSSEGKKPETKNSASEETKTSQSKASQNEKKSNEPGKAKEPSDKKSAKSKSAESKSAESKNAESKDAETKESNPDESEAESRKDSKESTDQPKREDSSEQSKSEPPSQSEGESSEDAEEPEASRESDESKESTAASPPPETPQPSTSPSTDWGEAFRMLAGLFKFLVFVVLLGIVLFYLYLHYQSILAWINQWLGGNENDRNASGETAPPRVEMTSPPRPFSSFENPVGRVDAQQVVVITFQALEAWAREQGVTRGGDETPSEFARRVAAQFPSLRQAALRVVDAYNRTVYGQATADRNDVQAATEVWDVMRPSLG